MAPGQTWVLPALWAQSLGLIRLFTSPQTEEPGGLPSMGFPRQNSGVGCHFLLQGIFPSQGSNPCALPWQSDSFTTEPPGKPILDPFSFCPQSLAGLSLWEASSSMLRGLRWGGGPCCEVGGGALRTGDGMSCVRCLCSRAPG